MRCSIWFLTTTISKVAFLLRSGLSRIELTVLSMQGNNFTGQIPAELCNCVRLMTLNLGNNSLSGPIPKEIGQLVNLDCLVLSHNQLTRVIPDEIVTDFQVSVVPQSRFVQHHGVLDLSYNRLSGNIPSKMGDCVVLVELMLAGNLFTGLIPPELSMLMNLSSLDLSSSQFNGEHSSRARRCASIARIESSV